MPIPAKHKAPFNHGSFYHIYNRSVEGQLLFYSDYFYRRFLKKYQQYLSGLLDLYCYALIPNHFHLLASVKEEKDCLFTERELQKLDKGITNMHDLISSRFRNLFISHSLSVKNQLGISTNVFSQKFKHSLIESENYFDALVAYIHLNPIKHKLTQSYLDYPWTSFHAILNNDQLVNASYVIDWFGSKEKFADFHRIQSIEFEHKYWFEAFNEMESI